ncbi:TetR/AcrR family transcriptional regulator [Nonomuraea sp. NN258]|uniref:TetR/AcrR family transcriptional regulator n=1 Tax=Nonomuraea antri TaxID=2730852 RepID=UPI00156A5852|nr:TetR/AcrR family transcriptional regulator [Nonomuraea antri]NRQ38127.1 TetR/AcrR family transcriptional regulator [Nonomuraea antri]
MGRPRTTSDEQILKATALAIDRHGVGRLTLAAVAEQAGLAPATLVQRFGSKRGLLLALARQSAPVARAPFERAGAAHDSPLAALHAALDTLAAGVRTPESLANNLSFLQLDLTDPEFREPAARHARVVHEEITALLAAAVAAGELAAGTDVDGLARSVHVAYNGVLLLWALTGDGTLSAALRADVDRLLEPYRAG